jgi:SAM-dependent methyltransferase
LESTPDAMMEPPAWFTDLLRTDVAPRSVSDGIWSVLPIDAPGQRYDGRLAAYDRVVGNGLYNRLLWGSSPARYAAFARRALDSGDGPFLDAGCGSLVFTAAAYATSTRSVILLDQSVGMLEAARNRLIQQVGHLPERVALIQADLRELPFRDAAFSTVLSMGMLHLFDNCEPILGELGRTTQQDGKLFITSLVSDRRLGRGYLRLLRRAGEVAQPRTMLELKSAIGRALREPIDSFREGNMGFVVVGRRAEVA